MLELITNPFAQLGQDVGHLPRWGTTLGLNK